LVDLNGGGPCGRRRRLGTTRSDGPPIRRWPWVAFAGFLSVWAFRRAATPCDAGPGRLSLASAPARMAANAGCAPPRRAASHSLLQRLPW